jgi:hypothetical protein
MYALTYSETADLMHINFETISTYFHPLVNPSLLLLEKSVLPSKYSHPRLTRPHDLDVFKHEQKNPIQIKLKYKNCVIKGMIQMDVILFLLF